MHASRRATKPEGVAKARVVSDDPGEIPPLAGGRTTGPSRVRRHRGGARARTLGPERW